MDTNKMKQNTSKRKSEPKPPTSTERNFGANKIQIGGDNDASRLIGSIIEKGISETTENKPIPPPQVTVLPFPVARHRSHGPHWGPISRAKDVKDDNEDDDDSACFNPISAFAKPVKRKQKKGLDLRWWREIAQCDNSVGINEVEKNRLEVKKAGKYGKDGEEADNVEKRKLLSEVSMGVDFEAGFSSSIPPAKVGESVSSAADMEIDNPALLEMLKMQEQFNSTIVSSSSFNGYRNEKGSVSLESEIDVENRARLQSMSAEDIAEAQAEIMEKMNPELLNLLKKRGQRKLKKQNLSRSDEAASSQLDDAPVEDHSIKESEISLHARSESSEIMTASTSKDMESGQDKHLMHNLGTAGDSLWDTWTKRVEAVRGLRFSLEGTVIADERNTGNTSSDNSYSADNVTQRDLLRTEGDPGAAGYTIKEAVQLTRSVIPGQRVFAFHLLASVLDNVIRKIQQNQVGCTLRNANQVDKSNDWEAIWAYALGPEPELVLALRTCLDDNHHLVVLACAKVIQCVLSCDLNENFFEISEKIATYEKDIFTAPVFRSKPEIDAGFLHGGFWKYNAKPSNILTFVEDTVDDGIEGEHTIRDDIAVAEQDLAAGLVRMGILPKISYLLEADHVAPLEECVISILTSIARHSPTCANAIMKCQGLVHMVVSTFTTGDNIEVRPFKIKSVKLLKVLAQSDKKNCIALIKNGSVQAMTWHLYRYTSSLDNWLKSGKEICKLSSALMVEELGLWKVCIHYGFCITHFSDIFPALCLWLNPPTFTKLQENNLLGEFASVSKEAYLVLEALVRKLPNFYMQKHPTHQMLGDETEIWSWSYVTPMVDLALKWIASKSDPYISKIFDWQKGITCDLIFQDSSVSSLLWVYSAVLQMLSTLFERVIPEGSVRLQQHGQHVPWLPEFVPNVGLEIVKNGFLSFIDLLCHLRQHGKYETSLASACCFHGLFKVLASTDNLILLAKSGIHSPSSQEYSFSREGKILEDGLLKSFAMELRSSLNLFMKLVTSEWQFLQSIETFGRGGPSPGVGIGWGASGGGFWSITVLLAQTDARLLIDLLYIFQNLSSTEVSTHEEMAFSMHMITSLVGVFLTTGPRDKVVAEKALDILLSVPVLRCLDFYTGKFLQLNGKKKLFGWEYKGEDYVFFGKTLASHFKNRWLSVKRKLEPAIDENRTSKKGKSSLETIHEDLDIPDTTRQDNYLTSLAAEWAHQRLPLPTHWFLSPVSTISIKQNCLQSTSDTHKHTQDPCDTLEVAKAGLFFLLGLEAMSSFMPSDVPFPVRCVPLFWKLHCLSVILLVGMGALEDDKSRDVYEALQDLYGQLVDEARSIRSAEHVLEENKNVPSETGKKSTLEFLRFQSEIHESYSTFLETLVAQFSAISYGDVIFGRQVAVYLHRCNEASVRLAAWNALANARVLEILPPLEKCFAEAEGYLEPVEDDEGVLEAYVKAWVSGALDRAATRGSMTFTLVLHHLSSFIFLFHTNDKITLRNKLAKSLLRDYSKKQRHEGMMLKLVQYYKSSTSHSCMKQEVLSLQASDIEKRFEVLLEACDRDSSLLTEVERLKSAFLKIQSVD